MKKIVPILAALALALALPAVAFAEGGNGSGGGNGGGASAPLVVESASIEGGELIEADGTITLAFSKNVCAASVRDANMELVSVVDAQGADVPVVVTLADDQVEPDKKREMVIGFEQPLGEGTYVLTAKAGITAKSGDALAEDYVLEFGVAAQGEPAAAAADADTSAQTSAPAAETSAPASDTSAPAQAGNGASQQGGFNPMPVIIGGVIIVIVLIAAVVLKKKN